MDVAVRAKRPMLTAAIMVALMVLTAVAPRADARGQEGAEPTFFARISDNPSVAGHAKVYSRGQGRLDLVGSGNGLTFDLSLRSLTEAAVAVEIRGEGSATGQTLVQLYGPPGSGAVVEGEGFRRGTVAGVIEDGDVDLGEGAGTVGSLIWDELAERNGVVVILTGDGADVEVVGVVRPRPVAGWIAV